MKPVAPVTKYVMELPFALVRIGPLEDSSPRGS